VSFSYSIHRLQPLVFPSWVRFMLLLAFSSKRSYKHITRFAERVITRPHHSRPPFPHSKWHKPFDLGVTMSLTGSSPYLILSINSRWSDTVHGYLKSTFISSGHYHHSTHPLCQMGNHPLCPVPSLPSFHEQRDS
jgi:hypothetical protein